MDAAQIWNHLEANWWWMHSLLVGLSLGGSVGIWAYREAWYGLSTFFASPVETRSPFRALVQVLASLVLLIRSGIAVALILTWPWVLRHQTAEANRWIAVAIAAIVWVLCRLALAFGGASKPAPPRLFKRPIRWAYYRSIQTPDSLVSGWADFFLGVLLHAGLGLIWYEKHVRRELENWSHWAAIAASIGLILMATSLTVLIHPTPTTHETEQYE